MKKVFKNYFIERPISVIIHPEEKKHVNVFSTPPTRIEPPNFDEEKIRKELKSDGIEMTDEEFDKYMSEKETEYYKVKTKMFYKGSAYMTFD